MFYSFLFGKAGAQTWSSYSTLMFFMLLNFISRREAAVPTSQVHGYRHYPLGLALVEQEDKPASTSIHGSSTSCVWPALARSAGNTQRSLWEGISSPAKWELPDLCACGLFAERYQEITEEVHLQGRKKNKASQRKRNDSENTRTGGQ